MSIESVIAGNDQWHVEHCDVLDGLAALPTGSVHVVCSSPPYWGLRDYGIPPRTWSDGSVSCYGLEKTPDLFIAHSVEIFAEVRRVLRDDGTLWLNLGDSYATGGGSVGSCPDGGKQGEKWSGPTTSPNRMPIAGMPPGSLLNVPHRVAAALQADGWIWRSTVVWAKRSPMPESIGGWRWKRHRIKVANSRRAANGTYHADANHRPMGARAGKDFDSQSEWSDCPGCPKCESTDGYVLRRGKWRPTNSHEYIFVFAKSDRYFCDGDSSAELATGGAHSRGGGVNPKCIERDRNGEKQNPSFSAAVTDLVETRNMRSVWNLSSEPSKLKHFAAYPTEIPRRAIRAATSRGGYCAVCGVPWAPIVDKERVATRPGRDNKIFKATNGDAIGQRHAGAPNLDPQQHIALVKIAGFRPTCNCGSAETTSGIVLDPFNGSGTTGVVCKELGCSYIGLEASAEYVAIARERIARWRPKSDRKLTAITPLPGQLNLFGEATNEPI